jgi:hypothetical protein
MENYDIAWVIRDYVDVYRKPFDVDDIKAQTHIDDIPVEIFALFGKLPIVDGEELFEFKTEGFFKRALDGKQQCYIMEIGDRTFFIDTQGYDYARYVGEIIQD